MGEEERDDKKGRGMKARKERNENDEDGKEKVEERKGTGKKERDEREGIKERKDENENDKDAKGEVEEKKGMGEEERDEKKGVGKKISYNHSMYVCITCCMYYNQYKRNEQLYVSAVIGLGTFDCIATPKDFENKLDHAAKTSEQFVAYSILHYPDHKEVNYLTFQEGQDSSKEASDPFKEWNELAKEAPSYHQEGSSSLQKDPSSHQETSFSLQKAPSTLQKEMKTSQNRLLIRLKKKESVQTRSRPKPVGHQPAYYIRSSKPGPGTGMNSYGNKPGGSGMNRPKTEPMRARMSREEKLYCIFGQRQQQQQQEKVSVRII